MNASYYYYPRKHKLYVSVLGFFFGLLFVISIKFFLLLSHVSSTSCHETDEACVQDTGPSLQTSLR